MTVRIFQKKFLSKHFKSFESKIEKTTFNANQTPDIAAVGSATEPLHQVVEQHELQI